MADSDKNILITPNRGATSQPSVVFTGQGNDPITVRVLDGTTGTGITAGGALSFEGSAGQLFSVVNRLGTGSIFSVNDISGIPSIDVDANGTIEFAPFTGYVAIGLTFPTEKLHVAGNILGSGRISAVGGLSAGSATFGTNVSIGNTAATSNLFLRGSLNNILSPNGFIRISSGGTLTGLIVDVPSGNETSIKPTTHEIEFYDQSDGDTVTLNAGLVVGSGPYTVALPSYGTTLAGLAGQQTFTGLKSFSAGISASGGITFNSPISSTRLPRFTSAALETKTANFSPTDADNGKVFVINHSSKTPVTVTLDSLSTGWRAKFISVNSGLVGFNSSLGTVYGAYGADGGNTQVSLLDPMVEVICYGTNTYFAG